SPLGAANQEAYSWRHHPCSGASATLTATGLTRSRWFGREHPAPPAAGEIDRPPILPAIRRHLTLEVRCADQVRLPEWNRDRRRASGGRGRPPPRGGGAAASATGAVAREGDGATRLV